MHDFRKQLYVNLIPLKISILVWGYCLYYLGLVTITIDHRY